MTNLYAVHRDERIWDEPDAFKPSRFLDEEGKVLRREELIPFSAGKYSIFNQILQRNSMFVFFVKLLILFTGFPPVREIRGIFENFFHSGKSGKNRGFSAKIRE